VGLSEAPFLGEAPDRNSIRSIATASLEIASPLSAALFNSHHRAFVTRSRLR